MGYLEGFGVTLRQWPRKMATTKEYRAGKGGKNGEPNVKDVKRPKPERAHGRHHRRHHRAARAVSGNPVWFKRRPG